jgi:hypothetical protein
MACKSVVVSTQNHARGNNCTHKLPLLSIMEPISIASKRRSGTRLQIEFLIDLLSLEYRDVPFSSRLTIPVIHQARSPGSISGRLVAVVGFSITSSPQHLVIASAVLALRHIQGQSLHNILCLNRSESNLPTSDLVSSDCAITLSLSASAIPAATRDAHLAQAQGMAAGPQSFALCTAPNVSGATRCPAHYESLRVFLFKTRSAIGVMGVHRNVTRGAGVSWLSRSSHKPSILVSD